MTIKGTFGPPVQIWRQHRDGSESYETLPEFLAKFELAGIPQNEPNTARAKIIRRRTELDPILLAGLAGFMAKMPAMEAA